MNIKYSPVIKIDPSTLVHDEPPAAAAVNSNELPQEVIDSMSSEQYQKYLEEKNDTSLSKKIVNVFSKIGGGIVSTFSDTRTENGRSRSRNLTAQVILDQKEFLTLNELSCASIREALENYKKNKKYLFKCTDITAENMRQEGRWLFLFISSSPLVSLNQVLLCLCKIFIRHNYCRFEALPNLSDGNQEKI